MCFYNFTQYKRATAHLNNCKSKGPPGWNLPYSNLKYWHGFSSFCLTAGAVEKEFVETGVVGTGTVELAGVVVVVGAVKAAGAKYTRTIYMKPIQYRLDK